MPEAIGPRTYLVGRILSALLGSGVVPKDRYDEAVVEAIRLADLTLNAMGQSDGKPKSS